MAVLRERVFIYARKSQDVLALMPLPLGLVDEFVDAEYNSYMVSLHLCNKLDCSFICTVVFCVICSGSFSFREHIKFYRRVVELDVKSSCEV